MKFKKIFLLVCLIVCIFAVASVSAGDVNDSAITSEDTLEIELAQDSGINEIKDEILSAEENSVTGESEKQKLTTDYAVDGDNFESIQTKINQASAGDRIFLGGKNYTGTGQEIVVDKPIAIIGGSSENDNAYATLDAIQLSKIMRINADNVVLKGIIFINGYAKEDYYTYGSSIGGAIFTEKNNLSVVNCNFTGNHADAYGGAVYFDSNGAVINCNFTGNYAGGGGAVYFKSNGNVINCNFTGNYATAAGGGAVYFKSTGAVINCNFTGNNANVYGGAVYFKSTGAVTNGNFADNSANGGGAIFSGQEYSAADTCIFKTSSDTTNINTVIYPPTLNVDNFTTFYGSGEKLTFDLKTNSNIPVTNGNISISVYFKDNDELVGDYSCLSGQGWIPDLPLGSYYAIFDTEYAEFKAINRTLTVNKLKTELFTNPITATYNTNKNLIITLKDENGNPVAGVSLSVDLIGAKNYITDKNGQVKVNVGKLTPKTYNAKITFGENVNYLASSAKVKVTVKKAKAKITAKKKTFKKSTKIKKYTVKLKNNKKPIAKVKLTLKIKNKKYTAKTNKNGKATFKIKKLTKKGKYTATVTFKANKYYKKVTKKVKITVK